MGVANVLVDLKEVSGEHILKLEEPTWVLEMAKDKAKVKERAREAAEKTELGWWLSLLRSSDQHRPLLSGVAPRHHPRLLCRPQVSRLYIVLKALTNVLSWTYLRFPTITVMPLLCYTFDPIEKSSGK